MAGIRVARLCCISMAAPGTDFEAFQDPYLRETVRLTLDQRGALRSPPVDGTITLAQLLADIEGLRTTLNIERWHVVGHS